MSVEKHLESKNDVAITSPPSGYVPGRRSSMHGAIDLTKIDTRLYEKKTVVHQPSVESVDEEILGRLNFSLQFNPETSILTVKLNHATNLRFLDVTSSVNPYVRISVIDEGKQLNSPTGVPTVSSCHGLTSTANSKIFHDTPNPVFDEQFIFELTDRDVLSSVLEIVFLSHDKFSNDESIGIINAPLRLIDLSEQTDHCLSIRPNSNDNEKSQHLGDVMISMSYLPSAERLAVAVIKARNLRHQESTKDVIDSYVKVIVKSDISKKLKKKKTATCHSSSCPTWNEALVFNFAREHLPFVWLELSIFHENKLGNDERLGTVRLTSASSGDEKIHLRELVHNKSSSVRWHKLT